MFRPPRRADGGSASLPGTGAGEGQGGREARSAGPGSRAGLPPLSRVHGVHHVSAMWRAVGTHGWNTGLIPRALTVRGGASLT